MELWEVAKARTAYGSNLLEMPEGSIPIAVKETPRRLFDGQDWIIEGDTIYYEVTYLTPVGEMEGE